MATVSIDVYRDREDTCEQQQLHRIRSVRLQQGVSLRSAARATGTDIRQLRLQEQETTDLRISDLHKWVKALDVPVTELLAECEEPLSRPVLERARMVKLMKTTMAILERSEEAGIRRMAQMMADQLLEVMPELEDVGPWHNYGQRRSLDELGVAADRTLNYEALEGSCHTD